MSEKPSPVRLPKVGGGDYRLATEDPDGWYLTVWTKGIGRVRTRHGTELADGPQAMVESIVADCLLTYHIKRANYVRQTSLAATGRPGFRPGSRDKVGRLLQNEYHNLVDGWYTAFAQTIKMLQLANWPTDVEKLSAFVESYLPTELP